MMAPPKTDNDTPITFRVPRKWLERAVRLVPVVMPKGVNVTRTDVIRMALIRGLDALEKEHGR